MKKINKGMGLGLIALLSFASCSDWSDHYEDVAANGGKATLWQTLQEDPELSDFCEVLQNTKYFRQHKVREVSYAEMLMGGQAFTVLAPKNGTFDKKGLLEQLATEKGDSVVEKQFVLNHLSRSIVSSTGEQQKMFLANNKRIMIGQGQAGGIDIAIANKGTHNGIVHVMKSQVPYYYNLFEAVCDLPQYGVLGEQMKRFSWDEFDEQSSLSSGTVDGVPVYVDSVVIEHNKMLESIGLLNAEDSTYLMVAPSREGWNEAMEMAKKYFVYDEKVEKRDSLQQYWAMRGLLDDAVYSTTVQKSPTDSLVSWWYNRVHPEDGHIYYKPFEPGGIMGNPVNVIKCSNGTLYETAKWPFTPWQTFYQPIRTEVENRSYYIMAEKLCTHESKALSADSISGNAFIIITPEKATSNWELTIRLMGTLSGKYDICVVTVPRTVLDKSLTDPKPCKFNATLTYPQLNGSSATYTCLNESGKKDFLSNPLVVDTIVVAKDFEFPACNYGQNNTKVTLNLKCNISSTQNKNYSREMYLDCILLRPTKED